MKIKAGTALVFSQGCYSSYISGEVYIALKDFNYIEQAKRCYWEKAEKDFKKHPEEEIEYLYIDADAFESFLVREGFLGLCVNQEIHIGDYSEFFNSEEWKNKKDKYIDEVLAPVPSYEKLIMTKNLSERAHLEMYKARGEKVRLEKENTKLKELLHENRQKMFEAEKNYGFDDSIIDILTPQMDKIDKFLGDKL